MTNKFNQPITYNWRQVLYVKKGKLSTLSIICEHGQVYLNNLLGGY